MGTLDKKGGLSGQLGQHPAGNIPAGLDWEQMGPKIQAALAAKKRRRRLLWWWLPSAVLAVAVVAYFALAAEQEEIGSFPIPAATAPSRYAPGETAAPQAARGETQDRSQQGQRKEGTRSTDPSAPMASPKPQRNIAVRKPDLALAEKPASAEDAAAPAQYLPAPTAPAVASAPSSDPQQDSPADGPAVPLIETLLVPSLLNPGATEWAAVKPTRPARPSSAWYLELDAGSSFQLSPAGSSPGSPQAEVAALSGFSGGVRLGRAIRNTPYAIWTGVLIEDLVQRERLSDAFAVRLYQPGTIDTIFRNTLTGEESFAYTDSISGTRAARIQQHSTFRSFAVPLMVSRAWAQGGWQGVLQTGADLQLSYWEKGRYLSEGYQLLDAPTDRRTGVALRVEGQILLPSLRFGRPFVRGSYRRFLYRPAGLAPGTAFRPQSASFTIGWQVRL